MFIKDLHFRIEFSTYAESHFCKAFLKKYKTRKWVETKKTIFHTLENVFRVQNTNLIDLMKFSQETDIGIFKLDFRVAGTKFSPKTSGNRVVFVVCNSNALIRVLIVYGKDHCSKKQSETRWILEHIKNNFPEYKHLI